MGDEERFLDEEGAQAGEEVEVGKKVGFLPAVVLKILKWGAIGLAVLLLVFFVAYGATELRLMGRVPPLEGGPATETPVRSEPRWYFENIEPIRGQTADNPPQLFVISIVIGYERGNNAVQTELNERKNEIHNIALRYLSNKMASELQNKYILTIQTELMNQINQIMRNGVIREVFIKELQVIPW